MKVNNYRISIIIVLFLQIACMLVSTPPSARGQAGITLEPQIAGAPTLASPAANVIIDRSTVGSSSPPPRGTAPTRYQVCVADEGQSCQQPGASIFPPAGQPAITGTSYTVSLPVRFQGKRFQWSVAACVPPRLQIPGGGDVCTYATARPLTWRLPPPVLSAPPDGSKTTLRPTLSISQSVPGADRYLFCLAKPGAKCLPYPTATSAVIVVEARGTLGFRPSSEITQFNGQTINWTAAACNDVVGCSYQPAYRRLSMGGSPSVFCGGNSNEVEIRNHQYWARISKATGEFTVKRLTGAGGEESVASDDSISFRLGTSQSSMTDDNLTNLQVR